MHTRGLNSDPHACVPGTLLTETPLQVLPLPFDDLILDWQDGSVGKGDC